MQPPAPDKVTRFRTDDTAFHKTCIGAGILLMLFACWPILYAVDIWRLRIDAEPLSVGLAALSVGFTLCLYGRFIYGNPASFLIADIGSVCRFSKRAAPVVSESGSGWTVLKRSRRSRRSSGGTSTSTTYVVLDANSQELFVSRSEPSALEWKTLVAAHTRALPREPTASEQVALDAILGRQSQLSLSAVMWLASPQPPHAEATPAALTLAANGVVSHRHVVPPPGLFDRFWRSIFAQLLMWMGLLISVPVSLAVVAFGRGDITSLAPALAAMMFCQHAWWRAIGTPMLATIGGIFIALLLAVKPLLFPVKKLGLFAETHLYYLLSGGALAMVLTLFVVSALWRRR